MTADRVGVVLAAAVAGLLIGPLLGIAVDRVAERLRFSPEHRCTHCRSPLGPRSLVPLLSWVDRCPRCGRHKGWRYPLVDGACAVTFGLLALRFGAAWQIWPYLVFGAVLVVLSAIDIETHLLPNVVVWPAIAAGLFAVLVLSGELADGRGVGSALLGAAVYSGFIGAAHIVYAPGMGRGDVKLALLLGLFVGWTAPGTVAAVRLVLYAMIVALLGGALVGLTLNRIRRRPGAELPLGPSLAVGAVAIVVATPTLTGAG